MFSGPGQDTEILPSPSITPAVTEQRDFLRNDERSILIFKYPDILSCSIWLTPVAITDLVLALRTIQTLVIRVTFKESHVSSFSFEPSEAWQQFQQSGQGGACVQVLCRAGERLREAPGLLQSLSHAEPH